MDDEVEIIGKLKLDTTDAEKQLESLSSKKGKGTDVKIDLPKDTKVKLPDEAKNSLKGLFSGDKGIENVGKLATSALGGVQGLSDGLAGMIPALTGVAAAIGLIVKLLQDTDTMKAISAAFQSLFDALRQTLAPILTVIGEVIIDLCDILKSLLPILDPVVALIRIALEPIMQVLKILKPLAELIGKIAEVSAAFSSIFTDTFMGIIESITSLFVELVDMAIKPLLEILQPVIEFFNTIKRVIQDFITTVSFGLIRFDKSLTTTNATKAESIKSSLDVWETTGGETPAERSARLAAEAADSAAMAAENTYWSSQGLGSSLSGIGDTIGRLGDSLGNLVSTTAQAAGQLALDVGTALGNLSLDVSESIGTVVKSIGTGLGNIAEGVGEGLSDIASGLGQMSAQIAEGLGSLVKGVGEGLGSLVSGVGSGIGSAAKGIGEGIGEVAKGIGNGIATIFGKGWLWKDGGTLPLFAGGGSIGAQIWGMNERGNPEFLFNAGGHDTVINSEILEDAMYNAQLRANAVSGAGKLEVGIKEGTPAGPRELAQWLLPSLKFLLKGGN